MLKLTTEKCESKIIQISFLKESEIQVHIKWGVYGSHENDHEEQKDIC